jgi:hypothetical protein
MGWGRGVGMDSHVDSITARMVMVRQCRGKHHAPASSQSWRREPPMDDAPSMGSCARALTRARLIDSSRRHAGMSDLT